MSSRMLRRYLRTDDQLSPQVRQFRATLPPQPVTGLGTSVVAGHGFRISGDLGFWVKLKSAAMLPARFSLTSGRGSGRPSVLGLSRALARKSSSMNFR